MPRNEQKRISREARIVGHENWPSWMAMGFVTYSEAARRMALWFYQFDKSKKLPNSLQIVVRDQNGNGIEFPFKVVLSVDAKVTALRDDDGNES